MKARRYWLMAAAALLFGMAAEAVPVRPGQWITVTLADGTTVSVEARGDEYSSWWRDAQGRCYVRQGDTFVMTDLKTINAQRRAIQDRSSSPSRRAICTSTIDGLGNIGWNAQGSQYSIGEWEIPVLMVEFSDVKFNIEHTPAFIQEYLTKEGFQYNNPKNGKTYGVGCVRDYFVAQSKGMFQPNFKVLGKVTLDKPSSYYGENVKQGNNVIRDLHCLELPGDAMQAAVAQIPGVDFAKYDIKAKDQLHYDGIPLIVLLFAGIAESEHVNQPYLLWPHQRDLWIDENTGTDWRKVKLDDNVTVTLNSYFIGNELSDYQTDQGETVTGLAGIGVMAHELGHALGLPDWYATDNDPVTGEAPVQGDNPFGNWSVMDTGPYCGGNGNWTPMGYTAYERSYLGWWSIGLSDGSGRYKLYPPYTLFPGTTENIAGDCIVFRRDDDPNNEGYKEYFIIETRQPSTWYPNDLGTGLMLSRYSYDSTEWQWDRPNNTYSKRRAIMITADGTKLNYNAANSNLFGNGVNTISNQKFMSGADWGVTISDITKNIDGSVEFYLQLATGISNVKEDSESTVSDAIYDLQGRQVDNPSKGVYIVNGKKVFIK